MTDVSITVPDFVAPNSDIPPRAELRCKTCGTPLDYAGRGRKPQFCDEHKGKRGNSTGSARSTAGNASAEQAADAIDNAYSMLSMGLLMLGLSDAASALAAGQEAQRRKNVEFLKADKDLAKSINKASAATGRFGFFATNLIYLAPVVTEAVREVTTRRAERMEREDAESEAAGVSTPGMD